MSKVDFSVSYVWSKLASHLALRNVLEARRDARTGTGFEAERRTAFYRVSRGDGSDTRRRTSCALRKSFSSVR